MDVGFLFFLFCGYPNKHNANDNTSGVITITHILEKLPQELRDQVCVIYFDNEEKGLIGSSYFKKNNKSVVENKLCLNFDCVGDGDTITVMVKKDAINDQNYNSFLEALKECSSSYKGELITAKANSITFTSDHAYFKKGVGICALRTSVLGKYASRIHTPFDTVCREENLEYLSDSVVKFLSNN